MRFIVNSYIASSPDGRLPRVLLIAPTFRHPFNASIWRYATRNLGESQRSVSVTVFISFTHIPSDFSPTVLTMVWTSSELPSRRHDSWRCLLMVDLTNAMTSSFRASIDRGVAGNSDRSKSSLREKTRICAGNSRSSRTRSCLSVSSGTSSRPSMTM